VTVKKQGVEAADMHKTRVILIFIAMGDVRMLDK
jgi:hypothetical protein